MKSQSFSVTSSRVKIIEADNLNRTVYIHVIGAGTVYIGGSDVTSLNGMLTEKNAVPFELFLPLGQDLYAITAGDTHEIRVLTPSQD
jgi:hypothetical protein